VFTKELLIRIEQIFKEKCSEIKCSLLEFNGEKDHVHLLVSYPAKSSISSIVNVLKGVSARLIRKEFWLKIKDKLWGEHFWSSSYCAVSAGGAPLAVIKKYIEQQNAPTSESQIKKIHAANTRWNKNGDSRA